MSVPAIHETEVAELDLPGRPRGRKFARLAPIPKGEEIIYVIRGTIPGGEEMKIVCLFSPATGLDNYKMYDDVDFPD